MITIVVVIIIAMVILKVIVTTRFIEDGDNSHCYSPYYGHYYHYLSVESCQFKTERFTGKLHDGPPAGNAADAQSLAVHRRC